MMTLKDIGTSAAGLGNLMKAGIPLDQSLARLAQMQLEYSEFWSNAVVSVQAGRMLSDQLSAVWPSTLVGAVKAGESSGSLEVVFTRIEETVELQLKLRGTLMQLAYPISMGVAGIMVFLGFMIFVLPGMSRSLDTKSGSMVFMLSQWMSAFAHENWLPILAAVGAAGFGLVTWVRTEAARVWILETALTVPVLKDALRDLLFGLWANYMAMVVAAGIGTSDALKMTAVVLPAGLNESVLAFERDLTVQHSSMADAVDKTKLHHDDPRSVWWPLYICNAFLVAEQTGTIDKELLRVAPSLIKEGTRSLERSIATANVVALGISAMLAVAPLAAYYVEIFTAISNAGR